MDEARRSMDNEFRARPKYVREPYESCETKEALGVAHL